MKGILLFVAFLVWNAMAEDYLFADDYSNNTLAEEALILLEECSDREYSLCFKERAIEYLEQLPSNIVLGNSLHIRQIASEVRSGRHLYEPIVLPEESRAKEQAIDAVLMDRILDYLSAHTFEFRVPPETLNDFRRSFQEEGRKKKKKTGLPMMMLFQLKAATIGALMLKAVALVAFKALIIGKVALLIAGIIALKKLFDHKHHTSTYEVVAHPHFEDHGHYDRSFNQDLAYRGQDQVKNINNNY